MVSWRARPPRAHTHALPTTHPTPTHPNESTNQHSPTQQPPHTCSPVGAVPPGAQAEGLERCAPPLGGPHPPLLCGKHPRHRRQLHWAIQEQGALYHDGAACCGPGAGVHRALRRGRRPRTAKPGGQDLDPGGGEAHGALPGEDGLRGGVGWGGGAGGGEVGGTDPAQAALPSCLQTTPPPLERRQHPQAAHPRATPTQSLCSPCGSTRGGAAP